MTAIKAAGRPLTLVFAESKLCCTSHACTVLSPVWM
jgi:hypothetical protein